MPRVSCLSPEQSNSRHTRTMRQQTPSDRRPLTILSSEQHAGSWPVYEFHPLFRDFLQSRIKSSLSRDGVVRLQKRAASILEKAGRTEDAVGLYYQAEDWTSAVRLILADARELIRQGRSRTLEAWLARMPAPLFDSLPWLSFWFGVCKTPFDPAKGLAHLEKAFRLFEKQGDRAGTLLSWSEAVDALMVGWDDLAPLDFWIRWLSGQGADPAFSTLEIEAKCTSAMAGAMAWRQPYRRDIGTWVKRALDATRKFGNPDLRLRACANASYYYLWMGDKANDALITEEIRTIALAPE